MKWPVFFSIKKQPKLANVSLFGNSLQVILNPKATLSLCYSYNWMKTTVSINSLVALPTTSSICLYIPVSTLSNETLQLLFILAAELENPMQAADEVSTMFPEPQHELFVLMPLPR